MIETLLRAFGEERSRSRGAGTYMTDYRLYSLDGKGKIGTGEWVEATGDAEAIMLVRAKKLSVRCELWDHTRLVATIEPFTPLNTSPGPNRTALAR